MSSSTTTPSPGKGKGKGKFYFAYGSNLSPTQMSQRCPSSCTPIAIAKLSSYTWFICSRGYANIIAVPPRSSSRDTDASIVWGVVYWLTTEDEIALDGYEGFSLEECGGENPNVEERVWKPMLQGGCSYNKFYLKVEVERWLVPFSSLTGGDGLEGVEEMIEMEGKVVGVLIYVDEVRTTPGRIKDEYVRRLGRAAGESIPLGIPEGWVEVNMKRYGVEWGRGGEVVGDKEESRLFMREGERGEWEKDRTKFLMKDVEGKKQDQGRV